MTRLPLSSLLGSSATADGRGDTAVVPGHEELFAGLGGVDHVVVITDQPGLLSSLAEVPPDSMMRGLFASLAGYAGIAVVVSAGSRLALPRWARVFDEKIRLQPADGTVRMNAWMRLAGDALGPSQSRELAMTYELEVDEIQVALHQARLRAGIANRAGEALFALVDQAAAAMSGRGGAGPVLFG